MWSSTAVGWAPSRRTTCRPGPCTSGAVVLNYLNLRGAALEAVNGAASLRGAIISPEQLLDLAPHFAREFGIRVAEVE